MHRSVLLVSLHNIYDIWRHEAQCFEVFEPDIRIVSFNMYSVLCNALCKLTLINFHIIFMIEKLLDIHRNVFWNNVLNQKSLVGMDEIYMQLLVECPASKHII